MKKMNLKEQTAGKRHQQDPARNDQYDQEKTRPFIKERKRKLVHGRYIGKKWSPQ